MSNLIAKLYELAPSGTVKTVNGEVTEFRYKDYLFFNIEETTLENGKPFWYYSFGEIGTDCLEGNEYIEWIENGQSEIRLSVIVDFNNHFYR